jgi:hypothetical protein
MTCDTENKSWKQAFTFFVTEIQPMMQPYADKLNRKLVENEHTKTLEGEAYTVYLRNVKKSIELFREEKYSPAIGGGRTGTTVRCNQRQNERRGEGTGIHHAAGSQVFWKAPIVTCGNRCTAKSRNAACRIKSS